MTHDNAKKAFKALTKDVSHSDPLTFQWAIFRLLLAMAGPHVYESITGETPTEVRTPGPAVDSLIDPPATQSAIVDPAAAKRAQDHFKAVADAQAKASAEAQGK